MRKIAKPTIAAVKEEPLPPSRIRAAVIGKMFSGKSSNLNAFATTHNVSVIQAEVLLNHAINVCSDALSNTFFVFI